MSILTPTPESPSVRDTTVVRHFRTGSPAGFLAQLNRDLGLGLSEEVFLRLQTHFKSTALRDPTVGELRLLDAAARANDGHPSRIAVGELTTSSPAVAETWADMMAKHGTVHGAFEGFRSDKEAAPPCSLTDALTLTARYLRCADLQNEDDSRLLSSPGREAMASAAGYTPAARVTVGDDTRTLWVRKEPPLSETPARTGDFILYLPRVKPGQVQALVAAEAKKPRPALGAIRAVAEDSLLLTLTELCPAAELHAERLAEGGRIPVRLLCSRPATEPDGTCGYLARIPLKQLQTATQILKDAGINAIICGQVRTGGNLVVLIPDGEGKRELPAATLPASLLRSMAAVNLYAMNPEATAAPAPLPYAPAMTRLPSSVPAESGLTPDGCEAVALTIHGGRILPIPEENTLITALSVDIRDPRTAYTAAAETTSAAARTLGEQDVPAERIRLTVSITASDTALLTDGTALAAICGVYCAAAGLALPVEEPVVDTANSDIPLRLTVTAWAGDTHLGESRDGHWNDRQWCAPRRPEQSRDTAFLLPVLRRSYEDSLRALSAALNRDRKVRCVIRPLAMNPVRDEETDETRYILHPESEKNLLRLLEEGMVPVFSMNEGDTRLLLAQPAVEAALRHHTETGKSILVLGESCKPFAELGLLPPSLLTVQRLPARGTRATVTYTVPEEPATRLPRADLLAPADLIPAMEDSHLLTLHLPDGTAVPDGFLGCDGKVLGLLNGLDTVTAGKIHEMK